MRSEPFRRCLSARRAASIDAPNVAALVGGSFEYLSMIIIGIRALLLVAARFYLVVLRSFVRNQPPSK